MKVMLSGSGVASLFFAFAIAQWNEAKAQTTVPNTLDEVLVTGEYPGPPLWKISKDGHVLWILGAVSTLPKSVKWNSSIAEAAIKNSQEVLLGTKAINDDIGPIKAVRHIARQRKAEKNPRGTLKDSLPASVYERFYFLKNSYAPDEHHNLERLRPFFAGERLFASAHDEFEKGFEWGPQVSEQVKTIAKKYRVKTRYIEYETKPEHRLTVAMDLSLKNLTINSIHTEITCLQQNLDKFEGRVEEARMQVAANNSKLAAWATGNLKAIREIPIIKRTSYDCGDTSAKVSLDQYSKNTREERERAWISGVLDALVRNNSTFAIYNIDRLLDADGPLKELLDAGVTVEEN